MMRVVHDETRPHGRIVLLFGLSGDTEQVKASYSTYVIQPDLLLIEYRMDRQGFWSADDWGLSGQRVLSDGKLSKKIRAKRTGRLNDPRNSDTPAWIREIATKYQPSPVLITSDDVTVITYPEDS